MTADQSFNAKLAKAQEVALAALSEVLEHAAEQPPDADPALIRANAQLLNIRLRAAQAILRLRPRETDAPPAEQSEASANQTAAPAAHAQVTSPVEQQPTRTALIPRPSQRPVDPRRLLDRAGSPEPIPRRDRAA